MTSKTKNNQMAKTALLDAITTVIIYLIFILIISGIVASGKIRIENVKIITTITLFVSGGVGTYIVCALKGKDTIAILISGGLLLCVHIIISICWKDIEPDGNGAIISAIAIAASKVIPSVIKNTNRRNGKRKRNKNKR